MKEIVRGFSKLKRREKIQRVAGWVSDREAFLEDLEKFGSPGGSWEVSSRIFLKMPSAFIPFHTASPRIL